MRRQFELLARVPTSAGPDSSFPRVLIVGFRLHQRCGVGRLRDNRWSRCRCTHFRRGDDCIRTTQRSRLRRPHKLLLLLVLMWMACPLHPFSLRERFYVLSWLLLSEARAVPRCFIQKEVLSRLVHDNIKQIHIARSQLSVPSTPQTLP